MGRRPRRGAGEDSRSIDGHPGQPLAALSDPLLPGVGALGVLSGRRRLWIPRSAPGCDGSHGSRPPGDARASAPGGGPAVRGGGRAALVAHALGSRRPDANLRRCRMAAVRRRPLRGSDGRPRYSGRGRALPRRADPCRESDGIVLPARRVLGAGHALRALRAGPRPDPCRRLSRPPPDRHGRLERRDERDRPGRARRERLARVVSPCGPRALRAGAEDRGDERRATVWREHMRALKTSLEQHGWDGRWYRRAYFDDGTPLGSGVNSECRIDSIAQSWGVISGAAEPAHATRAMAAVEAHLVQRDQGLILLFTPPFARATLDPGYIKGYPPGIRENGGQYTHAAIWSVIAWAALGEGATAHELFSILNPIRHASADADVERYKVEPYV